MKRSSNDRYKISYVTSSLEKVANGVKLVPSFMIDEKNHQMTKEFFKAVSDHALMTLHIVENYGENTHHIIEAMFKSFARALKQAICIDEKNKEQIVSSKGVL